MHSLLDHLLWFCFLIHIPYVSSAVAKPRAQAPLPPAKTYDLYDASPTDDAYRARMTKGLHPRQVLDPDSEMAKYFATRPTSYSSIPYAPASVNNSDVCILWDPSCKGDKDAAIISFFEEDGVMSKLLADSCFTTGPDWDSQCTESPKPDASLIKYWSTVRSFMREPACESSRSSAHELVSTIEDYSDLESNCCFDCGIGGPNVDVYYWESPHANTDCLSIIGTDVKPPLEGATTEGSMTYWGITTAPGVSWKSVKTTMVYTSVNGVYFKMPWVNPWDDPLATYAYTQTQNAQSSPASPPASITSAPSAGLQVRANLTPLRPRQGMPLNASQSVVQNDFENPSTVVYNGHTFTSPSIYVDFYSLRATDDCGYLGAQNIITSTLLSFAPGELSTYGGPLTSILGQNHVAPTAYNFDDLPCPPRSIMSDQWYMPEPGQPYRPIIAFPPRLTDLDPAWKSCTPRLFTGYDPPRALVTGAAMVANAPAKVPASPTAAPLSANPLAGAGAVVKDKSEESQLAPMQNTQDTAASPSPMSSNDNCDDDCDETSQKKVTQKQETPEDPSKDDPSPAPAPVVQAPSHQQSQVVSDPNDASDSEMNEIHQALAPASPSPQPEESDTETETPAKQVEQKPAEQKAAVNDSPAPSEPQPIASVGGQAITPVQQETTSNEKPAANNQPSENNQPAVNKQSENVDSAANNAPNEPVNQNPTQNDESKVQAPSKPQVYQVGSGQRVTAGGAPVTVDNTPVYAPSTGGVVVGSSTYHAPPAVVPTTQNVAGHEVVAGPNGFKVDNQPIQPGASVTASNGQVINLDNNNNIHVGEQVAKITPPAAAAAPVTTIGGQAVTPLGNGKAIVAGTTLSTNGAPINIAGTPFSLSPQNSLVVNNKPFALPSAPAGQPTTVAGQRIVPLQNGAVSIAGVTLTPGAHAKVGDQPVSLDTKGSIHFAGTNVALPPITSPANAGPTPTTVNGEAVLPLSNGAVSVQGTTLTPGSGPVTAHDGKVISLGTNGLVVGSSTVAPSVLSSLASSAVAASTATTVAEEEVRPVSNGVSVAGTTLHPGQAITKSNGEVISVGSTGLVVGSSTVSLSSGKGGYTIAGSITPAAAGGNTATATGASPTGAAGPGDTGAAGSATATAPFSGMSKQDRVDWMWVFGAALFAGLLHV